MSAPTKEAQIARVMRADIPPPLTRCEWWRGAVIYEAYIRSFRDADGDGVGDLKGVTEKLDYIADLGVDALWLSPFFSSPQKDFGYDVTDFRNVDPIHGTMEDFLRLLRGAHARGLKLLIDFVPAHTSDEHPWFVESRSSRDNDKADWYVWADAAPDGGPPNNWLSSFGGSAWTWDPRRSQYYYHPFLECQPALDLRKQEVFEAMCGEITFWIDLGVDGVRLDAVQCLSCDPDLRSNPPSPSSGSVVRIGGGPNNPFGRQHHLFDRDVPEAVSIMEKLRGAMFAHAPDAVLIGELADVDSSRLAEKYTVDGRRLHAVYDFDLINNEPNADALSRMLRLRSEHLRTGWMMNVFSNHDSVRAVSNLTRFAVEAGQQKAAAKLLLFLQMTLRGGAVIYQGEELGLTHPQLERDQLHDPWALNLWPDFQGRDGCRTPFPWSSRKRHGGFTDGDDPWMALADEHRPLAVDRQDGDDDSCLSFVRDFLRWRRDQPVIKWGGERVWEPRLSPLVIYERFDHGVFHTCVVNFSLEPRCLPLPDAESAKVADAPGLARDIGDEGLNLPPFGFSILEGAIAEETD